MLLTLLRHAARSVAIAVLAIATTAFGISSGNVSAAADPELQQGFIQPPAEARPWVYWFWLNGNITREGITADLEAMQRVGIGGVLIMEVDQGAPQGAVDFMSPRWRELFQHVAKEADRLGLEINMNNDAGWNGSGGPWIQPDQAMQEVTWSEIEITGPRAYQGELPQPEAVSGYYRDIVVQAFPSVGDDYLPDFETQAGSQTRGRRSTRSEGAGPPRAITGGSIVDLTAALDHGGRLSWQVPPGTWTVVRIGHTCTAVENAPAPASGRGLECDKLSPHGIEANFAGMMDQLVADCRAESSRSLVATHIDSWENGSQNWTSRMRDEFQQRRGYDMTVWLPVMTGRVVESVELSQRFLTDLRRTVSELVIDHYAARMQQLASEHGLRFTVEAYGSPCDYLPYAGRADEPMGEFWVGGGALETCRGMASAAHVYGKRIVGAEAFTAGNEERWKRHPATIKALGDQAFCEGINRFVFHRYALQPWADYRPGMTMGPWGTHYERTQTWWDHTPAWHTYLARCQYLLRQGLFVADICYLLPENSPQGFGRHPREGFDWDECSAEVVLSRMSVEDGKIVLPDGMSYRLLVLPETRSMTLSLLGKIKELVFKGATVLGPPPVRSPGLTNYPDCDTQVQRMAAELWGNVDGHSVRERRCGAGRIIWGMSPEEVLGQDQVPADFSCGERVRYIHRATPGIDLYFVANPHAHHLNTSASFRVSGRVPELWWPDSGRIERAAVFEQAAGVTTVALPLESSGSVFVVFREASRQIDPIVSCALGDERVADVSAGMPPPIRVHRATYGLPGDATRTRDVTAKVQQRADSGQRSFRVAEMATGDDPAQGTVKTLIVDYSAGNERLTTKARDPELIHLTGEAVNIVVTKAKYGILNDPQRTRDVREKIQRLADAGTSLFSVAWLAADDDPAFLVVKTLELEYIQDDRTVRVTAIDPESVDLSAPQPDIQPPGRLHFTAQGKRVLDALKAGRYQLRTAAGTTHTLNVPPLPQAMELAGPWQVHFDPHWGGPGDVSFAQLDDWAQRPEEGVRFYSGTAVYQHPFVVPPELRAASRMVLDLGQVAVMAEVTLNGQPLGLLWKPPFRVDVTEAIREGTNSLEVRVVNLWINRMVGDEQLPDDSQRNPDGTLKAWPKWVEEGQRSPTGRYTFTSWRLWKKDEPLEPSGLLGPVRLVPVTSVELPQ